MTSGEETSHWEVCELRYSDIWWLQASKWHQVKNSFNSNLFKLVQNDVKRLRITKFLEAHSLHCSCFKLQYTENRQKTAQFTFQCSKNSVSQFNDNFSQTTSRCALEKVSCFPSRFQSLTLLRLPYFIVPTASSQYLPRGRAFISCVSAVQ